MPTWNCSPGQRRNRRRDERGAAVRPVPPIHGEVAKPWARSANESTPSPDDPAAQPLHEGLRYIETGDPAALARSSDPGRGSTGDTSSARRWTRLPDATRKTAAPSTCWPEAADMREIADWVCQELAGRSPSRTCTGHAGRPRARRDDGSGDRCPDRGQVLGVPEGGPAEFGRDGSSWGSATRSSRPPCTTAPHAVQTVRGSRDFEGLSSSCSPLLPSGSI